MFFCDPPGHTKPEHLFNHGQNDPCENAYVFFHDQEPVDRLLYRDLFDKVAEIGPKGLGFAEVDGRHVKQFEPPANPGHVVVSEQGHHVDQVCAKYGWTPHYYFYHGWACQDWFRGYDRSFLIPRAQDRQPTRTFMSPNRIVGGRRDHRVLFLYHVFKNQLENNHISAPRICPEERVDITSIAQKYSNVYQDITTTLEQAQLPRTFAGEDTQQMSSCWLTNFAEAQDSLMYVPTETVYFGNRMHITEKTFKAIALEMPFVLVAPAGSLKYLRSYGFRTFGSIIDESYDDETDDIRRLEKVVRILKELDSLTVAKRQEVHRQMLPIVQDNYAHFYRGEFSNVLWKELTTMLNGIQSHKF